MPSPLNRPNAVLLRQTQGGVKEQSQTKFKVGNRPNLKSPLRVREEAPGMGRPVGLTASMKIVYIPDVIGEETQSVGPLVHGPALGEVDDPSLEWILENQSFRGVSSLI
jgi:hypothetical protein